MIPSDGITAADLLRNHPQRVLDWRTVAEMTRQIVAALEPVHREGKAHGAVRPENLLVETDGKIALRDPSRLAPESAPSLQHCSPQQARGQPATPKDDVYSLGSTLYELLTGEPPFSAKNATALLEQIQKENPLPIPGMLEAMGRENSVPGIFKMVIDRCLQKNPSDRPELSEIHKLLPKEAAPVKKSAGALLSAAIEFPLSEPGGNFYTAPEIQPRRVNPLPALALLGGAGGIAFGTDLAVPQKAGAILAMAAIGFGLLLAKRRNRD